MPRLHALLFDLDGTLVNSDPLHYHAYRDVMARHGVAIDHHQYDTQMSGRPNALLVAELLPAYSADAQASVIDEKEARFRELATTLGPTPGLLELLDWSHEKQLKCALVTNAPRDNADFSLRALGLQGVFAETLAGDEVPRGKPDPFPYREALRRLGVQARHALVFEDSPAGIQAAAAARVNTIVGLSTTQSARQLREAGAQYVFPDFTEAALWALLETLVSGPEE